METTWIVFGLIVQARRARVEEGQWKIWSKFKQCWQDYTPNYRAGQKGGHNPHKPRLTVLYDSRTVDEILVLNLKVGASADEVSELQQRNYLVRKVFKSISQQSGDEQWTLLMPTRPHTNFEEVSYNGRNYRLACETLWCGFFSSCLAVNHSTKMSLYLAQVNPGGSREWLYDLFHRMTSSEVSPVVMTAAEPMPLGVRRDPDTCADRCTQIMAHVFPGMFARRSARVVERRF